MKRTSLFVSTLMLLVALAAFLRPDSQGAGSPGQSVNVYKLGGTAIDTNSGAKSAGTQRVVIATDQPALTNKLLVTPDLPAGASTAAKQPALGTAGTASADVISIQGIVSMTAVKTDGSAVNQPIVGSTAAGSAVANAPVQMGASDGTNVQRLRSSAAVASGDTANGTNADATVTLADPGAGKGNVIGCIQWSYSDFPTAGEVIVSDDSAGANTTVRDYQVTASGPGQLTFTPPIKFTAHKACTVVIKAGGTGIKGIVNVTWWSE